MNFNKLPEYFGTPNKLLIELQNLATKDTAEYFYNLKVQPEFIPSYDFIENFITINQAKEKLRDEISKEVTGNNSDLIAEFGVNKGESFVQLCSLFPTQTIYGFDAFKGLPDGGHWKGNMIHTHEFKHGGVPTFEIPKNGEIINGWFENTLPEFFNSPRGFSKFLHIDCDVYSSTVTILENCRDTLGKGTIIVFDDYCNYPGWRNGEWKAWQEFVKKYSIKYEYMYVAGMAVGLKIIKI